MFLSYLLYHLSLWMFPPATLADALPCPNTRSATAQSAFLAEVLPGTNPRAVTAQTAFPQTTPSDLPIPPLPGPNIHVGMPLPGPVYPNPIAAPQMLLPVSHTTPMMPTQAMPASRPAYRVEYEFTEGPRGKAPPIRAMVMAGEGGPAVVLPAAWAEKGVAKYFAIATSVTRAGEDGAEVSIRMTPYSNTSTNGKEVYRAKHKVSFDKKTAVTLEAKNGETYVAQVKVHKIRNEMPAPVAYQPCPACPVPLPSAMAYAMPQPVPCPVPGMPGFPAFQFMPPLPEPMPLPPAAGPMPTWAANVPTRPTVQTHHLRLVKEGEHSRLKMEMDNTTLTCVRMTREVGSAGKITFAAGKKYIHVTGENWKAQAEQVECTTDGRVVLRGQVKLTTDKLGVAASSRTEVFMQVKNGKFEKLESR